MKAKDRLLTFRKNDVDWYSSECTYIIDLLHKINHSQANTVLASTVCGLQDVRAPKVTG